MNDIPEIDPKRSALLVMDYQPAILGRLSDAGELPSRMAKAIAAARGRGMAIGYVRVAFEDADYAAIPATNKHLFALAADRRLDAAAPETAILDAVAPQRGDIVVRKTRVGAFSTTDLDQQLRERQIETLVLAGISTSGVVLSTVRDAADRDYRILVLGDCCMDPDLQVHDVLMTKVFPRQATVLDSAAFGQLGLAPRAGA
jgi:nicotinamidase-related amidase